MNLLSNMNDCATKEGNENILMVTTEDQVQINETSLLSKENDQQIGNNTWLGDTGASTHYVKSDEGMFDVKLIDEPVKVGNGKSMRATKVGSLKMTVLQANGDTKNITLENVKYVPELWVNLFSITQALKKGMKIANDGIKIQLRKGDFMMEFDLIIATKTGYIIAVNMVPRIENHVAQAALDPGHRISLNKAHRLLGHIGEDAMRTTAKVYGWDLYGKLAKCDSCGIGKMKQATVSKQSDTKDNIPGHRLYIDISSVKGRSYGDSKFWLLCVDSYTDYCWSFFLKAKSMTKDYMIPLIKDLKTKHGIQVKYIRCDDAGENHKFEQEAKQEGLGLQFEYTGPGTPQRNAKVERKFATLYGRIRAMYHSAGLSDSHKVGLWCECASTATVLENLIATRGQNNKSSHELFYGTPPNHAKYLREFGEVGIVAKHSNKKVRSKLADRGIPCLFVGYAENHSTDVYRMFNLKTKHILKLRDVLWLGQSYGKYMATRALDEDTYSEEESDEDEETETIPSTVSSNNEE